MLLCHSSDERGQFAFAFCLLSGKVGGSLHFDTFDEYMGYIVVLFSCDIRELCWLLSVFHKRREQNFFRLDIEKFYWIFHLSPTK